MNIAQRIDGLEKLGRFIGQYENERTDEDLQKLNRYFLAGYRSAIEEAQLFNHWFTQDNLHFALQQWSEALSRENLESWSNRYSKEYFKPETPKTVAIIMAGNIPLVGFHDLLTVIMSGHQALAKPSSDDEKLMPFLAQILVAIDKDFASQVAFADGKIKDFDAIIATGSDNSARYFDYYFGKYPNIIRKNRSSVAVLSGEESKEQLEALGEDIFRYFGLGCRNVSKAYLPEDFDVNRIFEAIYDYKNIANHNKYGNNYDYNRAIYLMEKHEFLDNGFFIIKENKALHAPVSVLHIERYQNADKVAQDLQDQEDNLQCVVSQKTLPLETVDFGQSQKPRLWDYADNADTLEFLHTL